jgi:hypothetical protein
MLSGLSFLTDILQEHVRIWISGKGVYTNFETFTRRLHLQCMCFFTVIYVCSVLDSR